LLARSAGANSALTGEIAAIAQSLDPALPVTVAPLADNLKTDQALARVFSVLAGVLGTLALLLAIVGIYGMVAYTTSRRTREIGIRIALGADRGEVVGLIVRQGLFPVFWGILAGAVVSAVLARPLADAFAGVSPWDPITFIAMPLFLLATAGLASFLPARGALNADPVAALRCE
ncbi:MAG: FtsX-like permease family protein, partial [Terriglobales bacterium]